MKSSALQRPLDHLLLASVVGAGTVVSFLIAIVVGFVNPETSDAALWTLLVAFVGPFLTAAVLREFMSDGDSRWSVGLVGSGALLGGVICWLVLAITNLMNGRGAFAVLLLFLMASAGAFCASYLSSPKQAGR